MKKSLISALLAAAVALAGAEALAADTPASLTGAKVVNAAEAKQLQAGGATVLDVRVAAEYAESHIKGAVNVPYREKSAKDVGFDSAQDEFAVAKLPADKGASLITYCNGPSCWKSYKAAVMAIKAGYSKVFWFREGFPEWKAAGNPVE